MKDQVVAKVTELSLRDWFAGMALQGVLASGKFDEYSGSVELAYNYADEMLEERKLWLC